MRKSVFKQATLFVLLCALSSAVLTGCLGDDKPSPQPSGDPTPIATVYSGDNLQPTPVTPANVVPVLSLAANGARDTELIQGWPLLLEVSVTHPDFMREDVVTEPVTFGDEDSPWTGMVTVSVVDADGNIQEWPLRQVGKPDGAVELDATSFGVAYWTLGVEQTVKLEKGTYVVTAKLDTTSMESVGVGSIESIPVVLTVTKAPAKLSDEEQSRLAQSLAAQAVVVRDNAEAMSVLDTQLAKKPADISVLEFKGDLLAADGKTKEALRVYNAALKAFYEANPASPEPPTLLAEKQHDMMDALLATP